MKETYNRDENRIILINVGCLLLWNRSVHKGKNHVPKAVSDRDLLPDWVCDLNYVRSQALQTPSQSRTESAHCDCAVRAD